jgi:DNA mismatch repair ATPase MutS
VIAQEHFDAPLLTQLKERLGSGESGAADSMALLERLAERADVRLSPMLHFFVQGLTLWDFHIGRRLIDWKQRAGNDITGWMDAIGAIESLVALATLSYDNPDWVFPAIVAEAEPKVVAAELGHPLIAAEFRVANDVTVGPPNTLLLISGSNMAGKSTMLRSIGLNIVLAQAGSVVCATAMSCPYVSLYTSMRVQDSLERGVSYFMAELERLKLIVDAAGDARVSGGRPLLYLLDEILHGTNSAERSIAARHVLLRLVELGAIGAVTTHDLQLADVDEFARIANHVHFREEFSRDSNGRPAMRFDYRLRAGKAESSNALKLLELVGLAPDLANGAQEYDVRQ